MTATTSREPSARAYANFGVIAARILTRLAERDAAESLAREEQGNTDDQQP